MDPLRLLRETVKVLPAMKYALAVAGIAAVVAIVFGLRLSPQVAVFGALIVLGLMFVLVVFTDYAKQHGQGFVGPAGVLAWFYTLAVMIATILFMSSYFVQWPIDFRPRSPNATNPSSANLVHFSRNLQFKDKPFAITPSPSLRFGFSSLARDSSLTGNGVQIDKIDVTVKTINHSGQVCCDIWIFVGPDFFEFPEGATTVSEVNSYPWDINKEARVAPTQVKLNAGRPGSDTNSYTYHVTYDFKSESCSVEPVMGCKVKAFMNLPMNLPNGLYAQVLVWTGFAGANLDVSPVSLHLEGTKPY